MENRREHLEQMKSDAMEELRNIAYSCTLEEAFKQCICIQCHSMLGGIVSDFTPQELDEWLLEGLCPTCSERSNKSDQKTNPNKVRYAR